MEVEQEGEEPERQQAVYISDLPEELIEYIFFHLSPYKDLQSAKLVCRQWCRLVRGVVRQLDQNFHDAIACSQVLWTKLLPGDYPSITERYSHCACYYDKSLYIFGGCTSTNTTFNDLWRFNLATRRWIRPLATGTYPSPKACASMVVYKDSLVLFGGWSHPTPSPLHQAARFFNELHIYTPHTNRWSYVTSRSVPQLVAGHSACVIKDSMIIFGGSNFPGIGSNDIWIYDFIDRYWYKRETYGQKPSPRYGQSQIAIDDNHIVIIGGCGGPNQIFNDVWMLVMEPQSMYWQEIKVLQPEYSAPQLWCHPACKVHDTVVVLSKPAKSIKLVPPTQLRGQRSWHQLQSNHNNLPSCHSLSASNLAGASGCSRHDRRLSSNSKREAEDDEKNDLEAARASWPVHIDYNPDPSLQQHLGGRNMFETNPLSRDQRVSEQPSFSLSSNGALSSGSSSSPGSSTSKAISPFSEESTSNNASSPESSLPWSSAPTPTTSATSYEGRFANETFPNGASSSRSLPNVLSPEESNWNHNGLAGSESFHNGSLMNGLSAQPASNGLPSASGSGAGGAAASGLGTGGASAGHSPRTMPSPRYHQLSTRPNRQKQLEMLQLYEERIKRQQRQQTPTGYLRTNNHKLSQGSNQGQRHGSHACNAACSGLTTSSFLKEPRTPMHLHNLDISKVITEKTVTWQKVRENISECIPDEAIFYSLVEGRGELIMFGGIQRDINSMQLGVRIKSHVVSNSLYVLSSPRPNF